MDNKTKSCTCQSALSTCTVKEDSKNYIHKRKEVNHQHGLRNGINGNGLPSILGPSPSYARSCPPRRPPHAIVDIIQRSIHKVVVSSLSIPMIDVVSPLDSRVDPFNKGSCCEKSKIISEPMSIISSYSKQDRGVQFGINELEVNKFSQKEIL
ncbi:hypothetical protein LIER_15524 [Lithospermum erythrorhizon]|uniref:Uncharacterized protein n=1 Tax=Lithospermum erythrorhizon TaxID=34254 RepID=A0AAV3Q3A6_LITER